MNYSFLIDTSSPKSHLLLLKDGQVVSKKSWKSDRTLSNKLLETIDEFLADNKIELADIQRYGVQAGPGHYSALRTAVAVATMLAYAHKGELVALKNTDIKSQIKELQNSAPVDKIELVYE